MGLVNGREVPIIAGGKVNGRVGSASFAGVMVAADREPGVVEQRTTTGASSVSNKISGASPTSVSWEPRVIRSAAAGSWLAASRFHVSHVNLPG